MIAAKLSAGKVDVSGSPPASEMTSGRSVIAIRSRIAEDFIPRVREANSARVALELVRGGALGAAGRGMLVAPFAVGTFGPAVCHGPGARYR